MIAWILSSLGIWGKRTLCLLWVAAASASAAGAQERQPPLLPMLFDARERLARPDLSPVLRLRFLTTVDFPPFNFTDQTGRLAGFHVDLMREICNELKIAEKCQIQALPFSELEAALADGDGDAVMAGVAVSAPLRQRFGFSRPFMLLPARFARNLKAQLSSASAAALAGRPVGVVTGTAHEVMLRSFFPAIRAVGFAGRGEMLAALKAGAVDAVFSDGLQLAFWAASPASQDCCALFDGPYFSEDLLGEGLTIMARKQDAVLTAAFDHALLALSRNGRLQELYLRYFPYGLY